MPQYYIRERKDLNHEGETLKTYEVRSRGNVNLRQLAQKVGRHYRAISEGELQGIAEQFIEEMLGELADGYSVTLGELGNFSIRIGLTEEAKAEEACEHRRNSRSLCVNGLRFSPGKTFIQELDRKCKLTSEGSGYQSLHRSPYSREERIQLAIDYLKAHPLMRLDDYAALTHLSRTTASTELRAFADDPSIPIRSDGVRSAKVYVLSRHT